MEFAVGQVWQHPEDPEIAYVITGIDGDTIHTFEDGEACEWDADELAEELNAYEFELAH